MKTLGRLFLSIWIISSLLLPLTFAQSLSNQDKSEIRAVLDQVEMAVNEGDADAILELFAPVSSQLWEQDIRGAIEGKTINFDQEVVSFHPEEGDNVRVTGRFSAEGMNWSVSGFGNEYLLQLRNGTWEIFDTNFYRQFQPSSIFDMALKVGAMIFLPLIIIGIFWLWMLIDVLKRPLEHKVVWVLALIFLNLLGALIYYFTGRRSHKHQMAQQTGVQPTSADTWVFVILLLTFFSSIAWAGYTFWSLLQSTGVSLTEPAYTETTEDEDQKDTFIPPRDQDFQPLALEEELESENDDQATIEETPEGSEAENTENAEEPSDELDESSDESIESTFEVETEESETTPEQQPEAEETRESGVNARGDRIYLDDDTNVWIEYKSGDTLQLTKNANTTRGCGTRKLFYKEPVELSNDSQFALLPLYCEGDRTEIWVKEIDTARSGLVTYAEDATFIEEDEETKIKAGDATFYNIMDRDTHFYSPEKGISIHMKDGYSETESGNLEFGPKSAYGEWGDHHNYRLTFTTAKSADQVIADKGPDYSFYSIAPHRTTLNEFTAVLSEEPGMCTLTTYEVIGEKHNYQFTPYCAAGEKEHHAYLKEVISTIHFIK